MIPTLMTIVIGILAGIVLATPPGVINLTILHSLSKGERRRAVWVGAGSATLDIFYGALAMYSASWVYVALNDFIVSNPITMRTLESGLLIAMIGFGVWKLFFDSHEPKTCEVVEPPATIRRFHPYLIGCALALTHIVVPTFLPGYAYLATLLINTHVVPENDLHYWLMAMMFGVGNFLWVLGLVAYFDRPDPDLDRKRFRRVDVGIGTLFLCLGLFGASRMVMALG